MNLRSLFKKESFLFNETATSNTLKSISKEYNDLSDKIIKESEQLLNDLEEENKRLIDKAKLLKDMGFINNELVKQVEENEKKRSKAKEKAQYIEKFKKDYPNYKYISKVELDIILKKYNMVMKNVSEFKAYVPEINLKDIQKFFEAYPDKKYIYYEETIYSWHRSGQSSKYEINEATYNRKIKEEQEKERQKREDHLRYVPYESVTDTKYNYIKELRMLNICSIESNFQDLSKHYNSEPIVVMQTNNYGELGYIIITAWGNDLQYDPKIYIDKEEIKIT